MFSIKRMKQIVDTVRESETELRTKEIAERIGGKCNSISTTIKPLVDLGVLEKRKGQVEGQSAPAFFYSFKKDLNEEEYLRWWKTRDAGTTAQEKKPVKKTYKKRNGGELEIKKLNEINVVKCPHCKKMLALIRENGKR